MRDAVIAEAVRTPLGKRDGCLSAVHPADLSAHVLRALVVRAGIEPGSVDEVIWGCAGRIGGPALDIARDAVLGAGWPESVPGTSVGRQCGCSQQSIHFAAASVLSGHCDVVVAGGVASTSGMPPGAPAQGGWPWGEGFRERYGGAVPDQRLGAELIAERWGFSRARLDEFALESHEKAVRAQDDGAFEAQIMPIDVDGRTISEDEGVRRGGTAADMAGLGPAFREAGVITVGNSSRISDGAAALLITTGAKAAELGVRPMVRVHSVALAGADPITMLTAPITATTKVLNKSGIALGEIGAFEVDEAFASVPLAWLAEVGADSEALNPNGGAIALGHPLGGSGPRLMTTLVHHMRDNKIRYGLLTTCEGGGQADATILELL